MKWIIDLIKKNYKILLLGSILILLLIDIGTRFWFWKGLHLEYNASNFNNIVTPIGTIITALLFFILTIRQLEMLRRQNQVIESQNIKPHLEKEFERVKEILEKLLDDQPPFSYGIPPTKPKMNTLNCIGYFYDVLSRVTLSKDYNDDLKDLYTGNIRSVEFYRKRDYYKELSFLIRYANYGVTELNSVELLIEQIKFSKILEEDKHYFKNRIRMEFVSKYYDFMQSCYNDDYFSPIPDREFGSTNLILTPFHKSKFGQHYDFFIKELP